MGDLPCGGWSHLSGRCRCLFTRFRAGGLFREKEHHDESKKSPHHSTEK